MLTSIQLSEKNFFGLSCGMSKVLRQGKLHSFELSIKLWINFSPPFRVAPKLDASMQFSASLAVSRVRFEILPIKKFLFRAERIEISGKFQLFSAPNHFSLFPRGQQAAKKILSGLIYSMFNNCNWDFPAVFLLFRYPTPDEHHWKERW